MSITYVVDHSQHIILETWSGTVLAADLAAHWRVYLEDADVMGCRRTLVDLRDARIAFTGRELSVLVQTMVLPVLAGRKWATAILVADPAQYGTSRQYQVFAGAYSRDAIFSDWHAAQSWLLQQQA
jgi:hypothetical protein